jgi:homoserine/homoserine lactone efflux protein
MPLETIFLFVIADLMFCLTPGPATMVTVSHALPHGPQEACAALSGRLSV